MDARVLTGVNAGFGMTGGGALLSLPFLAGLLKVFIPFLPRNGGLFNFVGDDFDGSKGLVIPSCLLCSAVFPF